MDPLFIGLIAVFLLLVIILLVRTLTFTSPRATVEQLPGVEVDEVEIAEHLAEAIRIKTVSFNESTPPDKKVLEKFHKKLKKMYPLLHKNLKLQMINDFSLLYKWKGKDKNLKPVLFMAHQDVVPVQESNLADWQYPPFDGVIREGYIWGRGTMDIKCQLIAVMESVEHLLKSGYEPERSIYLAFGHDEEIGGPRGAKKVAAWLKEQGVQLEAVIDEGGMLVTGMVPGVENLVAMIGVAEKGYLTLNMSVEGAPGHSSTPPEHTAIGYMAKAITRLEAHPMPAHPQRFAPVFKAIGKDAPFVTRMAFANLWLFKGIAKRLIRKNPKTDAAIRTTTAATVIKGGVKDNILPKEVSAQVNFRLMPGDLIADVKKRCERVIADDKVKINIAKETSWEASSLSPDDVPAYTALENTIRQFFGDIAIAPYLVLGATDSRYYDTVCDNVYRFSPVAITTEGFNMIHGTNERIAIKDMAKMVQFFIKLMQVWSNKDMQ